MISVLLPTCCVKGSERIEKSLFVDYGNKFDSFIQIKIYIQIIFFLNPVAIAKIRHLGYSLQSIVSSPAKTFYIKVFPNSFNDPTLLQIGEKEWETSK